MSHELRIALSRLEDQLVGDMNTTANTNVQHMLKRVEYAHAAVSEAFKMAVTLEDRAESLQARLSLISDEIKDERARHDAIGQGGQKAGDRSPRMNRSMLVEFERLIGEEQGKYTYEYFLKMQEDLNAARREHAELRASIEKLWEETK